MALPNRVYAIYTSAPTLKQCVSDVIFGEQGKMNASDLG
jgi:hypothetical protein